MEYPHVVSEMETLERVLAGASISRYGDGEFKICKGANAKSQMWDRRLAARMRDILQDSGACLVGIPNLRSDTPKQKFWNGFESCVELLAEREYVSAFISRPDSAPWINTQAYWDRLQSLWRGRDVTLVRGSTKSLTAEELLGAGAVTEIVCPRQHAFAEYDRILERIGTPELAILCLGASATVMAVDLCAKGVHAVDLGHVGMFLRKHRRGDLMVVTDQDKAS